MTSPLNKPSINSTYKSTEVYCSLGKRVANINPKIIKGKYKVLPILLILYVSLFFLT